MEPKRTEALEARRRAHAAEIRSHDSQRNQRPKPEFPPTPTSNSSCLRKTDPSFPWRQKLLIQMSSHHGYRPAPVSTDTSRLKQTPPLGFFATEGRGRRRSPPFCVPGSADPLRVFWGGTTRTPRPRFRSEEEVDAMRAASCARSYIRDAGRRRQGRPHRRFLWRTTRRIWRPPTKPAEPFDPEL